MGVRIVSGSVVWLFKKRPVSATPRRCRLHSVQKQELWQSSSGINLAPRGRRSLALRVNGWLGLIRSHRYCNIKHYVQSIHIKTNISLS